ncbi:glycogen debranching enzyme family protein [filamentous cyanobacterium LEGE 11480]|uniref:Glycogen debranching enzyme family protein n=1 Tax=Romeriopsis navalis LEGE 11480 TaxID=2777977 RepID=A0A928Z261_9CYAN|nr:amylo-alpha-1,6-glucosidase [Romeriopsis navalis]MBE9028712.1 glycogen debranching enzyme family protein [Romeriopsis navalis LEGE 11480]
MTIQFGREICGDLAIAQSREWLVANGIGGYASGTVAGGLNRRYHGLLVGALQPPLGRTLLVSKLDAIVEYADRIYPLSTNHWSTGITEPHGYRHIEQFRLAGSVPVWTYALGDAQLSKRIWMQPKANTTYVQYQLQRASQPIYLSLKALVNYRDYHSQTQASDWQMQVTALKQGICVQAFPTATPIYLFSDRGQFQPQHDWYQGFDLLMERYRGLPDQDDHLYAADLTVELAPGESLLIAASTEAHPVLDGAVAWSDYQRSEQQLREHSLNLSSQHRQTEPEWIQQLVLAAAQFIVDRPLTHVPDGKTIIAGYPWFGDWGRDTMISLPGLTIAAGRPEIARTIIRTFARYLDQGMLPNLFPDAGETPEYNTVDAILWYFEAIRAYNAATGDDDLLQAIWPALNEVIDWHRRGTRYNIHLDTDGLIYAGETGAQLTWMDAKVGDWVVTPRIGKPIEISALWYNALRSMAQFAQQLGKPADDYQRLAAQTRLGFQRFWQAEQGYCYDVLDGPEGNDDALRPNQIFAVSLPFAVGRVALFNPTQQQSIVDICARSLLTSHGLRSLSPEHPQYVGQYGGNPLQRDGAYHQGTTWGWLIGPYVQAHWHVYGDAAYGKTVLQTLAQHLQAGCVGSLSEVFDGDPPFTPRGCFAQAWTVAEVLRVWRLLADR